MPKVAIATSWARKWVSFLQMPSGSEREGKAGDWPRRGLTAFGRGFDAPPTGEIVKDMA